MKPVLLAGLLAITSAPASAELSDLRPKVCEHLMEAQRFPAHSLRVVLGDPGHSLFVCPGGWPNTPWMLYVMRDGAELDWWYHHHGREGSLGPQ